MSSHHERQSLVPLPRPDNGAVHAGRMLGKVAVAAMAGGPRSLLAGGLALIATAEKEFSLVAVVGEACRGYRRRGLDRSRGA